MRPSLRAQFLRKQLVRTRESVTFVRFQQRYRRLREALVLNYNIYFFSIIRVLTRTLFISKSLLITLSVVQYS